MIAYGVGDSETIPMHLAILKDHFAFGEHGRSFILRHLAEMKHTYAQECSCFFGHSSILLRCCLNPFPLPHSLPPYHGLPHCV